MPFTPEDKVLIYKHLGYGATSEDQSTVDQSIKIVEEDYDFLIPTIQADLATLESLDQQLTTEQGSVNSTLVRADVLAWSENKDKLGGIKAEYNRILSRIRRMMKFPDGDESMNGCTPLMRS